MKNFNTTKPLEFILASASPRRQEILKLLNIPFKICPAPIDEQVKNKKDVIKMAQEKALWVLKENPQALVLGADTVVMFKGRILEKPANLQQAQEMLLSLSGKTHKVITGVCLAKKGILFKKAITTFIKVNKLSLNQIQDYLNHENVLDAAGSYKIQGSFAKFVPKIKGDYLNVVGLPLFWVYQKLKKINFLK